MKKTLQREAFRRPEGDAWQTRKGGFMAGPPGGTRHDPLFRAFRVLALAPKFLGNPAYSSVYHSVIPEADRPPSIDPDQRLAVTVLYKSLPAAYPDNPFRR